MDAWSDKEKAEYLEHLDMQVKYAREWEECIKKIGQSQAIYELWPEVFDDGDGQATSKWTSRGVSALKPGENPLNLLIKLTVTNSAGEERVFDAKEALDAGVNPPKELT